MTALSGVEERSPGDALPVEVTSYVGRDAEIVEAERLLREASLVTMTGPGGVGKTRLALRVASMAGDSIADNVVFVPLAELREEKLLVNTIVDRLGIDDRSGRPATDMCVDALQGRKTLLVLDNCEHLVDASAELVDTLVKACPDLVVLATSRQSLGVAGERNLPVPPLAVPEPGDAIQRLPDYDAVRLFVDRATAVVPSFAITQDNADDVIQLCRQLDGLPLAIELAAVRLRALSVRQITERLSQQFTLLTGGGRRVESTRHETLRALIDWSHELCTAAERLLWARLSVFSGGVSLDAAEQVCAGDGLDHVEVLDVIDGLIDKSILLREEQKGAVRYRMLETIRQYGEDRLRASGDLERMKRRHRDWYVELSKGFEAEWVGPNQLAWVARLRREYPNVRVALDFCASDPDEAVAGMRLLFAVKEYWIIRGLNTEGRIQLRKLLDVAPPDAPGRASALWIYAFYALVQNDMPAYQEALTQAAEVAEVTHDERARAYVLHVRAYAALIGNNMPSAAGLFGSATEALAAVGDLGGELWSKYNYGIATALAGDLDRGGRVLRECIDAYVARGEVMWRSWALWSLAAAEYLAGDVRKSLDACLEVLHLQQRIEDRTIIAFTLTVMAGCAAHSGQDRWAARLFGAAAAVWQSLGVSPIHYAAFDQPIQQDTADVTGRLGWEAAAAEFTAGHGMSTEQAMTYALSVESAHEEAPARPENPLTKRENEIAELVAKGMTNREIAQALVIAQRTAETHVEHVLTKLGFTNRTQIAAWVVDSRRQHADLD